jgi:hypothetical protein
MFQPHPNLSDHVNGNVVRSEIEGGVYLRDLPHQAEIAVVTQHREYIVVVHSDGSALISGHPEFCPEPVRVRISGSNWGGSMLKTAFIGRGMHMEFHHPQYEGPIVTSRIVDIRMRDQAA